jgi:hypothetical protein
VEIANAQVDLDYPDPDIAELAAANRAADANQRPYRGLGR